MVGISHNGDLHAANNRPPSSSEQDRRGEGESRRRDMISRKPGDQLSSTALTMLSRIRANSRLDMEMRPLRGFGAEAREPDAIG